MVSSYNEFVVKSTFNHIYQIYGQTNFKDRGSRPIVRFEGKDPSDRLAVMDWDVVTGVNDPAMVNVFNLEVTR